MLNWCREPHQVPVSYWLVQLSAMTMHACVMGTNMSCVSVSYILMHYKRTLWASLWRSAAGDICLLPKHATVVVKLGALPEIIPFSRVTQIVYALWSCMGITWHEPQTKCEIASKLTSHTAFKSVILSVPNII